MDYKSFLAAVVTLPVLSTASLFGNEPVPCYSTDSVSGGVAGADTFPAERTLGEITVSAPKVIHKADMDVYYPSKSVVEASQNGFSLINNMMIPTLNVNDMLGTVRTDGQDVQIRINGRQASVDELRTLNPTTIKRLEWIDDPGVRYGEAVAVLNVITVNPDAGGSLMVRAMPALYRPWGNAYADLKLNNGRSQFEIGLFGRYCNRMSAYREYSETFTMADGTSLTRTETPVDGYVSQTGMNPYFSYSYVNPDKTTVWTYVEFNKRWPTTRSNTGILTLSQGGGQIMLHEVSSDSEVRPKLSVYLEQRLANKQTLAFDVSASLSNNRSGHDYRETGMSAGDVITDISTRLRERQHKLNVEADYIRQFNSSRVTGGVKYSGQWTTQRRETGAESSRTQQTAYLFGEYFQKIGKFNITAGVGAQYLRLGFEEGKRGHSSWSWQPRLTLNWNIAPHSKIRASFSGRTSAPSASQTDSQWQQIDGFQYQIGNRDLRSYAVYKAQLRYSFSFWRVQGSLDGRWSRAPRAIAPFMEWHDGRLVTAFENSRGSTTLQFTASAQVDIIPKYIVAKGSLRYYRGHTAGTGYSHNCNAWSGDVALMCSWRNFTLTASYEVNPSTLSGETIQSGERISIVQLAYRWKDFFFEAGMFMPFSHYSMSSESLNRYNTNRNLLRSNSFDRMAVVSVSYNLSWGRQRKAVSRKIEDSEETETSKAAGR